MNRSSVAEGGLNMRIGNTARRLNWRGGVDLVASLSMIVVAVVLLVSRRTFDTGGAPRSTILEVPREPMDLQDYATKGSPHATIGLMVFSDFECPFCRRFALETLPAVQKDLIDPGLLLLAHGHLPLESIHPRAFAAAALAECSRHADRFWNTHDRLFSATPLSATAIETLSSELGLLPEAGCLSGEGAGAVRRHQQTAAKLGISSTPVLLLGLFQSDRRLLIKRAFKGFQSAEAIAHAVRTLANPRP